jgi:hypothetical protein
MTRPIAAEAVHSVRFRAQLEFALTSAINMLGIAIVNAQSYLPEDVHQRLSAAGEALYEAHLAVRKVNVSEREGSSK